MTPDPLTAAREVLRLHGLRQSACSISMDAIDVAGRDLARYAAESAPLLARTVLAQGEREKELRKILNTIKDAYMDGRPVTRLVDTALALLPSPAPPMSTPMTPTEIARVAHEVNRAYCQSLGDMSQPTWEDAPEWQRTSAENGVSFHIANPDADPAASHANWLREKIAAGWKYGPNKSPERMEHPCCVPYDELPPEQRAKDYIFRSIVHALAQ